MDRDGDPHSVLHSHSPAPTNPLEERARKGSKAWKKARRQEQKKLLRQEAGSLELEQGPSELHKEDPQVRQITPGWRFLSPAAALGMDSDGDPHPHTPAPTNLLEEQAKQAKLVERIWKLERKARKKERRQELKKLRREGVALELEEQGPSELQMEDPQVRQITPPAAPHTQHIEEQARKKGRRNRRQEPSALDPGLREFGPNVRFQEGFVRHRQELLEEEEARRLYSSSPRVTGSPAPEGARVRQSVLYTGRPRRSKRSTTGKTPVEEHVGEVSSREFEALTLDQSPPTPDSTHRPAGTAPRVRQSALYSDRPRKSHGRQEQKPSQNKLMVEENAGMVSGSEGPTGDLPELKALALNEAPPKSELTDRSKECDTTSSETESEVVVEEEPEDESDFDLEEEWRKLKEYKERMFDKDSAAQSATLATSCDENPAVEHFTEYSGFTEWARRTYLAQDKSLLVCLDAQHAMRASSRDEPRCEVSDEDIIQNGKKWMSEEAMVAFKEYIGRTDRLRKIIYCFEELCHQCFNVECYFKIFHHFNFKVKTKLPSSDDWKLRTYFAEVKEIFGEKYYFCCPLESNENGRCYACSNQGVNDLRHPATGGFERGLPDTVFPYM